MKHKVAIVGCGLIGQKRAKNMAGASLAICADVYRDRAEALARIAPGALATTVWQEAVERPDIDIVIVATTNDMLADIAQAALESGKHVLVEKPAARTLAEIDNLIRMAGKSNQCVRVGFNHRYHPAMMKAREIFDSGALGDLMFIRARYGHGGRIGYEREWRANPAISGGGELIDQGVHVIDLAGWFLGQFTHVSGFAHTYFWEMPVDDNAFVLLRTPRNQTALIHVSCTEWKNLFSFEIYGRHAKLHVEGFGGSYGLERLAFYKMRPEMGPPDTTIWEYPGVDDSWRTEFEEFLEDIRVRRQPSASLIDARSALAVVDEVYRESGYSQRWSSGEAPVGSASKARQS